MIQTDMPAGSKINPLLPKPTTKTQIQEAQVTPGNWRTAKIGKLSW